MGTELERRGMRLDLPLWSARALIEDPDLVRQVHRDNAEAGAEILTANTFRTQRGTLERAGAGGDRAAVLTRLAVALAHEVAEEFSRDIVVAASAAPLEDCYRPDLVPRQEVVEREHRAHVGNIVAAGADFVLIETMNTIREAVAAAEAVRGRVPFAVSFVTNGSGALPSGEALEDAVVAVCSLGPEAIGINCVAAHGVAGEIRRARAAVPDLAIIAYANTLSTGDSPGDYAGLASAWVDLGARIVGGCCGTTPEHVAALGRAIRRPMVG